MASRREAQALPVAAGNGLLDRRVLLRRGLALASASMAAPLAGHAADTPPAEVAPGAPAAAPDPLADTLGRPPWMREPGAPFSPYGQPSPHERRTIRRIAANRVLPGNGIAMTPIEELEGFVTPNGLHFERHHNGVPAIDPTRHRLMIHGRVRQPLSFGIEELLRYPRRSHLGFIECGGNSNALWHDEPIERAVGSVHGLMSCSQWTGVPLALLLDEAGVDDRTGWAIAEGADAFAMNVSLPLAKLRQDAFVALFQNGERLRPENGYPMRLVVPGWEGVLHVKWLRRLELSEGPVMARNETAKYTELLPDGKARQFTFVMDVKSLITAPSHGQQLQGAEVYEITGLAWSGHGRIKRVEVSADGGASWAPAALEAPVLPRCFTRFRAPWHWRGQAAVLKSRAIDETGRVQPERKALIAQRGSQGYFHFNGVVAFAVEPDGTVRHVYA